MILKNGIEQRKSSGASRINNNETSPTNSSQVESPKNTGWRQQHESKKTGSFQMFEDKKNPIISLELASSVIPDSVIGPDRHKKKGQG